MPAVSNNPSLLQFVIFAYIHRIIAGIDSGGEIAVSSQLKGQDILIIIEASNIPASVIDPDSSDEIAIKHALHKMGIAMTEETLTDDRSKTTLIIPGA